MGSSRGRMLNLGKENYQLLIKKLIPDPHHHLKHWIELLRWNKPSGRLILLIPAGWSLWLTPTTPPSKALTFLIITGGLLVSGAGCIANDLWDRNIDKEVTRTKHRPLAQGSIKRRSAWILLCVMLLASLFVVALLPSPSRSLCIKLSLLALPPILLYPTAKRWFNYPQMILAICWGFAVLIPWAASESSLQGGLPLICCWGATIFWTFGFDTVYAMADQTDDKRLGLHSSVIALGRKSKIVVSISYGIAACLFAIASFAAGVTNIFWPIWTVSSLGMQHAVWMLSEVNIPNIKFGIHFKNQVLLGSLLLFALIIGRTN